MTNADLHADGFRRDGNGQGRDALVIAHGQNAVFADACLVACIVGDNMKAYRAECGYSQAKLAELVNTAPNYITQIENGKRFPTDTMLEKIAAALKRRSFELFFIGNYEKKVEKDWQTQVLSDLEIFIHNRIAILKGKRHVVQCFFSFRLLQK